VLRILLFCFGFRTWDFVLRVLICFEFRISPMIRPKAIILRAPGTNCDEETAEAWRRAGAEVETWHVNRLFEAPSKLDAFQILTIPGGFSYGDDLGAGRIMATRIGIALGEELRRFHGAGGLILGICNGFQALVRAGLLPGDPESGPATLAHNDSGRFEARWIRLRPRPGLSPFVTSDEPIEMPVAHGEGKWVMKNQDALEGLEKSGRIVLHYADHQGQPTMEYPANPNGSTGAVAGVCDPTGRIFGLMPHPERHIDPLQHPRWTRRRGDPPAHGDGLRIFENAVAAWR
jgi:phosphoribosylformylglycinamidine synthase